MRDDRARLLDILETIERIDRYTGSRTEAFENNELIQNWVASHIQIIGEASNHLSSKLWMDHPEVPWSTIIGMRHVLVHSYFEIDLDAVKQVLERDLPILKSQIEGILRDMEDPSVPGEVTF
jgi:uncharacterized protein with HEPN domain